MVRRPEQYKYSGHRAYLGLEPAGVVDVDPLLRHFGSQKKAARAAYRQFVMGGMELGHQEELYLTEDGRILGSEEFIDTTVHRIGESGRRARRIPNTKEFDVERLLVAVEQNCAISRADFCSSLKNERAVRAKEMMVLIGSEAGANAKMLSEVTGISRSAISRRRDKAKLKMRESSEISKLAEEIRRSYDHSV
jgi:hypothetical protein